MNSDYLNAILKKPTKRTPVWFMRQAGRYLPEYRETRKGAGGFLGLCKTPSLACEVTMQPLDRFDLDAAILFSDILTVPDAMGLGLYFTEGIGPRFQYPIKDLKQIEELQIPCVDDKLKYVFDAVSLIKKDLRNEKPLIGFSGSPWTLAAYMIEGGSSKNLSKVKKLMFNDPKHLHILLDKLSITIIDYLNAQIESGVDSVMIFDSWGGFLSKETYQEFSLNYMEKIISGLKVSPNGMDIPTTIFTKGGSMWIEQIARVGCDVVGLDWGVELGYAQSKIGKIVALQGNLDPNILLATPEAIRVEVNKVMSQYKGDTGHIFNLGNGITPNIDPEKVKFMIDLVHEYKR